jgi:hypothetical protein
MTRKPSRYYKKIKTMEHAGYQFEEGEASFQILLKKYMGKHKPLFKSTDFRVISEKQEGQKCTHRSHLACRNRRRANSHCSRWQWPGFGARQCFAQGSNQTLSQYSKIEFGRLQSARARRWLWHRFQGARADRNHRQQKNLGYGGRFGQYNRSVMGCVNRLL